MPPAHRLREVARRGWRLWVVGQLAFLLFAGSAIDKHAGERGKGSDDRYESLDGPSERDEASPAENASEAQDEGAILAALCVSDIPQNDGSFEFLTVGAL